MNKTKIILLVIALLTVLGLIAWSPWLTKDMAESKAIEAFKKGQEGIVDGCGVKTLRKVLFGYEVKLEFACGLLPADDFRYHQIATFFISFLGTSHKVSIIGFR